MKTILILGASSDIAKAIAKEYAQTGATLLLAGRNQKSLEIDANDLHIRYNIFATAFFFDATDFKSHQQFYETLPQKPNIVICVFGFLGEQKEGEKDFLHAQKIIETNYTGCISILNIVANDFEQQREGTIIGISSVAGERGRQSNYLYGSAKAGFTAYLSGLRNRLFKSNVHVLTVKPGFVYTSMTENLKLPSLLTAKPEEVAKDILKAEQKKKNVIYTKWFWKYIMGIISSIPETIFKKLKL